MTVASVEHYQLVMSDYFETLGIPIVAGRGFGPQDALMAGTVAIVNEAMARPLWPGQNPVGQRLRPNLGASIGAAGSPWTTVIGVARNVTQEGITQDIGTELYLFARLNPRDGWTRAPPLTPLSSIIRANL